MKTTVQKWGNSLGLRIPKAFAEEASVEAGTPVDLSVSNGDLIIRPLRGVTYSKDLVGQITHQNVHSEVALGEPEGREVW